MKKLLLLLYFISSFCYGQQRGIFTTVAPIDVQMVFKPVQYADQPVTINATPNTAITTWTWTAKNSYTGTTIDTETTEDPSFTLPVGLYDIKVVATKTGRVPYTKTDRHKIRVLPHRLIESECDVVINVASGNYFFDFSATAHPNYKIGIKGSGTAYIQPLSLHGTAGNPVIMQVLGNSDVNITCPVGQPHTLRFDGDFQYVVLNGTKDDGTNGLHITAGDASNAQTVVMKAGKFTDVEIWCIDVTASINVIAAAFSATPAAGTALLNATNWEAANMIVAYCNVTNAGDEGYYYGYNNDLFQSGYQPFKLYNAILAWSHFTDSGRDGAQPGGSVNVEIHDNVFDGWGKHGVAFQESAVSWNDGTTGLCYNNLSKNGKMAYNIHSGISPWRIFTSETVPRDSYFFSNVHVAGTQTGLGSPEPFCIYGQVNNGTGAGAGHYNVHIVGNTVVTVAGQKFMEESFNTSGFTSDKFSVINNTIVYGAATGGTTTEVNFAGAGTRPTGGEYLINNKIRALGSESDLLFVNMAGANVKIINFSSPVYDGTTTNTAARFPELSNYLNDILGFPILVPNTQYTFGAYSGYEKSFLDTFAPIMSSWNINNTDKDRVNFTLNETCTATTLTGFSIPAKTISAVTLNSDSRSGYFTVSVPFVFGDTPTITNAGGSDFRDFYSNSLSLFSGQTIVNNISSGSSAIEDITVGISQNGTLTGNNWNSTGAGGVKSSKQIPSGVSGAIYFKWVSTTNGGLTDCRIGIIQDATTYTYTASQLLASIQFLTNTNTDCYEGGTYRATQGGIQVTSNQFRFRADRTAGPTLNHLYLEWTTNGTTWNLFRDYGAIATGGLRLAVATGVTGKDATALQIQADGGTIP